MRNKELQSTIIKIVIFQLFIGLILYVVINDYYIDKINTSIVEQNQALIGNILIKYPELEEEIVPFITKDISRDQIDVGQEVLNKYGYTISIDNANQPLLRDVLPSLRLTILLLIGIFTIVILIIIINEYKKIYEKVREISNVAEKVVEGEFNIYLDDEGEGEFNILSHQFNQMAKRLQNTLDTLKKDKVFLKNTISDISHQLKTPLSALIMLNDLMLEDPKMDVEVRNTFLEKSRLQLDRMEWLTLTLLKVARIEAGAIEFKKEKVHFREVVDLAIETLKSKLKEKELSIEIIKDLNGVFYGDKEWTTEALINILKNSIEHSDKNANIEINIDESPLFSSVSVRDYGHGIDKKDIPNIFKRFYRGSTSTKSNGIGIGLNLAKAIIESQDGSITVNSKVGEGTIFTVGFLKGLNGLTKK